MSLCRIDYACKTINYCRARAAYCARSVGGREQMGHRRFVFGGKGLGCAGVDKNK